jgi:hypothetical protein
MGRWEVRRALALNADVNRSQRAVTYRLKEWRKSEEDRSV